MNDKDKKKFKQMKLLEEGFKLFTKNGIKETSVQDIADNAKVAKGTFYLYFKDKYELRDILIIKKSQKLFNDALEQLKQTNITDFIGSVIFIINYVIDELTKNQKLLQFISKDLGWGIFNKAIINMYSRPEEEGNGFKELFLKGIKDNNIKLENPEATLFMIIELVGSTSFTCISYGEPLSIEDFKPILYKEIRKMIENNWEIKKIETNKINNWNIRIEKLNWKIIKT